MHLGLNARNKVQYISQSTESRIPLLRRIETASVMGLSCSVCIIMCLWVSVCLSAQ